MEVEIYGGIEFTRFNSRTTPHPTPSLPFPVKEHMVQINSRQQRQQSEEGKEGEGGQGSRHERRKFQGLL